MLPEGAGIMWHVMQMHCGWALMGDYVPLVMCIGHHKKPWHSL